MEGDIGPDVLVFRPPLRWGWSGGTGKCDEGDEVEDPAAEDWDGSLGCGVREISAFVDVDEFTGGSETFEEGEVAGSEMEEDV